MQFFSSPDAPIEIAELLERSKGYREYLQSIKDRLPPSAFEFATAAWHYDHCDHRCPHDSWVESLTIGEASKEGRLHDRSFYISLRLLGAFHDGHILLSYTDVQNYLLDNPRTLGGHGDWLVDEIRLAETGLVLHEVLFSTGSRWLIQAKDISYEWQPSA